MNELSEKKFIEKKITKINLHGAKRHLLFCGGDSCCGGEIGDKLWDYLKRTLKDRGMDHVMRTRVKCLRICAGGPILLSYPEGIWFKNANLSFLERFIAFIESNSPITPKGKELLKNQFSDHLIAENDLSGMR